MTMVDMAKLTKMGEKDDDDSQKRKRSADKRKGPLVMVGHRGRPSPKVRGNILLLHL